jgi:hypothetical protein
MTSVTARKIARPLLHLTVALGSFSQVEGVFVPWFEGHRFAQSGRWTPSQVSKLTALMPGGNITMSYPETKTLDYAQGGLRFTTTLGSSDIGIQYYFGRLPRPAISGITPTMPSLTINIAYNPYHQIGLDYAQVMAGFNIRAELAANITSDLAGDDGAVYNPSMAWSFGFDRGLFAGINLNLQVDESVRLFNDKIGDNIAMDTEAGTDPAATRLTWILSKKFFRDELECKVTGIWGIEDKDLYLLPGIIWTKNDVALELSAGIFCGNETGELGQYWNNSFIKTALTYSF